VNKENQSRSLRRSFYFGYKNRPLPGSSGQELNEKDVKGLLDKYNIIAFT
jgi:hypothetical protein